jgi:hypothetical protein
MSQAVRKAKTKLAAPALLATLALGLALPAATQAGERIHFVRGNDNAAVRGSVTGGHHRDYVLGARASQTMSVSLTAKGNAYFNILPTGSKDVAIFIGSRDGEKASVRLPSNGDYTIRVYLMGDAKDSGRTVPYTLSVAIM